MCMHCHNVLGARTVEEVFPNQELACRMILLAENLFLVAARYAELVSRNCFEPLYSVKLKRKHGDLLPIVVRIDLVIKNATVAPHFPNRLVKLYEFRPEDVVRYL